jgi:ADP-ribosylglycohydrolase
MDTKCRLSGCLVGTAVGDALGLPAEGLGRRRQEARLGTLDRYRLIGRRGLVSDDTEHAVLVAQALIGSGCEPEAFARELASGLRRWFLRLPPGVGLATARACVRLLCGVPPARSGVASAGNGPLMRAPLLGVACQEQPERLDALIVRATRLTHTDRRALLAARAVAQAALGQTPDAFPEVVESVAAGEDTRHYAARIGCGEGVSGYALHTAPVALHAALSFPDDFPAALATILACGGDTDTTAAIVGGIVGARVGVEGIPLAWRRGLAEWPATIGWMEHLAAQLARVIASGRPERPLTHADPLLRLRNVVFLIVVLGHGFVRLLPVRVAR